MKYLNLVKETINELVIECGYIFIHFMGYINYSFVILGVISP